MKRLGLGLGLLLVAAGGAHAQTPAARLGDSTSHGGTIITGAPTVNIGGKPAARKDDLASCPVVPEPPAPPHGIGPIINGSSTVFIGGKPAARIGGTIVEAGATSTIVVGSPTVRIGD